MIAPAGPRLEARPAPAPLPTADVPAATRAAATRAGRSAARARSFLLGSGRGALLPLVTLFVWELLARAGVLPPHWFPAPTRLLQTLLDLAARGELTRHVGATLARIALGFALGVIAGTGLGIATGRSPTLRALLDPALSALRSIPSLAWVPLFLLWLGIGEISKVALIALGVFFPVYLNLSAGLDSIDRRLLEVAELYSFRGMQLVRHVLLPASLPAYITGLRSGLGLGWMFVVAAELMGASRGLGYLLVDGQTTSRPELVMSAIACFALLGKVTDVPLAAWSRSWQHRQ